ncbi:MAG TPA: PBP1A family penicillin-binding protein [Pyrinomonadaceae bacterium]|jgi:penicillin-binding protein 1B|nr:PBP1A family penicillin-binding protein [Pyrinomonadaceae bacterium]
MAIEVTSISERPRRRVVRRFGQAVRSGASAAKERKKRILYYSIAASLIVTLTATLLFFIYSYISYAELVDARLASGYLTSRAGIYAAPRTLRVGQSLSLDGLVALLRRAGYIESNASDVWSGSFNIRERAVEIHPRRAGANDERSFVLVGFDNRDRIARLSNEVGPLASYTLEPELLTADSSMKAGKHAALSFTDIPPQMVQAILSIEDRRFFDHSGLDLLGIGRAILRNAGDERMGQGGSTITQQLVKNTYLSPERTLRRKFAEAMIAFTLERRLSKQDILALYCNEVYLGQRQAVAVRGVAEAARVFFGKDLKGLTLSEAATIAGMIQSPNRYAPDRHPDEARARRNTVLGAMARDRVITNEEAQAAAREPLNVAAADSRDGSVAPYFIDYVNRVVESRLAASTERDERSLRIYTTIDADLQQLAESSIKRQLERLDKIYKGRGARPQAALVALDPKTGSVLAMVGGRSYADSQLNRATDARRQPGSVFKPVVYAAALESGISPLSVYMDAPRDFIYDRRAKYRPANYGGGYSMRDVTMRTGLIKSLNVVTVDVAMSAGLRRVASLAEGFGLQKPEPYPALALGTTEATPLELAAAYTALANGGQRVEPNVIARATDSGGADIIGAVVRARPVIKPSTAYMLTDMLTDVIDHGTARSARGAVGKTAIAGKTGTSRDGWFVGYTPNLVCAVWIGFDDNKQLGLTGAEAALPAWTEFVREAVELRPDLGGEAFERPAGITFIEIDPETGMRATDRCPQHERIALTHAFMPQLECYAHTEQFPMTASLDETEMEDPSSITMSMNAEAARAASTQGRHQALAARPAATSTETAGASYTRTAVDRTVRGRSTLVNEMGGGSSYRRMERGGAP